MPPEGWGTSETVCDPDPTAVKPSPIDKPSPAIAAAVSDAPVTHSKVPPARWTSPADSEDPMIGGSRSLSTSDQAIASSFQEPSSTFANRVPLASLSSVATMPPRRARSQSFGCNAYRARSRASGSCTRIHRSDVAANPDTAGEPRRASTSGPRADCMSAASSPARESAHVIAGRTGSRLSSTKTRPCIWPLKPTRTTAAPSPSSRTWPAAAVVARSHSMGSASAHPGQGAERS